MSALELARAQFGFTVGVHIIFPAITIGLASYLVVLEGLWLWRKDPVYRDLYYFWVKIFSVNFGMGVVSGLVMAYEFGTNWSAFSSFAGSITGPLLSYEVMTAFFLEAGFLGIMLFGWRKVGPGLHFLATIMVAAGSLISATWILASNSWLNTPQGYEIVNARVVPVHWLQVIFNPSFPFRLAHMAMACYLATALFVGAAGAWQLLRGGATSATRRMLSMAMWMVLILTPLQMIIGDQHGLNTLKYQPAKIAAMEGHWQNTPGESIPLILFGMPDMKAETTRYAIEVPYLGSLILTHDLHGQVPGLKEFRPQDRPNSTVVFWSFRAMVGLAVLMLVLGLWSLFLRWRGGLFTSPLFLRFATLMGPTGLIALISGWITTEVGRQPWLVYGVMRTSEGVSNHSVLQLSTTLIGFVLVYFAVFGTGIGYMLRLAARAPEETIETEPTPPDRARSHRLDVPPSVTAGDTDHPLAGPMYRKAE